MLRITKRNFLGRKVLRKAAGSGDGLVGGGGCVLLITYHSMSIATEQEFCGINCDREV